MGTGRVLRSLFCSLLLAVLLAPPSEAQVAQELGFSGSPNPVGSGARALGMGGAFIGIADDATAASWNPGGLIQLETPEISAVGAFAQLREKREFLDNPGASGTFSVDLTDLNYLSLAYPFRVLRRNTIVSLNYQTLYDFNKEVNANYYLNLPFPGPSGPRQTRKKVEGTLKAVSPALAVQVTPTLSLGATLNWFANGLGNSWDTVYTDRLDGDFAGFPYFQDVKYTEENEFDGINFNLGLLWYVNSILTLGAVYKSPFGADVHHREVFEMSGTLQNTPPTVIIDEDQTMEMPQSYGIGAAIRFSDEFCMGLDLYRTDWQDFLLRQADGREISLFTGQEHVHSDTQATHQVRLGAEYLFIIKNRYIVPVRAGLFYDPEPTAASPDDFYGTSLGSGIAVGSFVFDAAYQFRWGRNVRQVRLGFEEVEQDVQQHTVHMSVIYHF